MEGILPVKPPHLNHITFTEAARMEVWHHHVITQLPLIETCQIQEVDSTIAPAMNHQGCFVATSSDIERVMPFTCRHVNKSVSQGMNPTQAVYPRTCLWVGCKLLAIAESRICPFGVRRKRIIEHIETGSNGCCQENNQNNTYTPSDNLDFTHKSMFHAMLRAVLSTHPYL